jgi:alkylhydroperoxidase family enzyme
MPGKAPSANMSDSDSTSAKMGPMFLPDVENNPQIWHLFAFKPRATDHLARFTQEIMREPGPISPWIRELIAAFTSARNACPF